MKKISIVIGSLLLILSISAYGQGAEKFVSSKTHVKFFSHTAVEDIEANNYATVSTINKESGKVVFSIPMQGFEFEKSQMQKHFNSKKFLNTKSYPKAKMTGAIVNIDEIDFSMDGKYNASIEGELTIKGITKPVKESGTIIVSGNSIEVFSTFNVTLADYDITFLEGVPATNVAKVVEVTAKAEYEPGS